ncbi:MAG: AmmeMemoRadiSam system protein B [Candidatus Nanoarchaeia archaeon]|nr:AmmeMemoRadiSam system protein B [Candidatus Nanoarchaeia archaeon]
MNWHPSNKKELNGFIKSVMGKKNEKINGVIVPHAGYQYSGKIAAKAYSYAHDFKKAIIFGPSHYESFKGLKCLKSASTPLGDLKIIKNGFEKINYEHSIQNQLPFLKYLGVTEVLPLIVGDISLSEAESIAEKFKNFNGLFVFSTDLSHFLKDSDAKKVDSDSVSIIKKLKINDVERIDACGINALKIFMQLARIKKFKPKLLAYENSSKTTGDAQSVVGYASFIF